MNGRFKMKPGILPLSPSLRKIAVIGPSADDPVAVLGNYNGISSRQVTPLEGMIRQFPNVKVRYALGATYTASTYALVPSAFLAPPDGSNGGLLVECFDNSDLQGQPKVRRTESRAYFDMDMEDAVIVAAIGKERYSIRWTGTLTPPSTGEYDLTVRIGRWNRTATARLFLDDMEFVPDSGIPAQMTRQSRKTRVQLQAGRKYVLRVEYRQPGSGGTLQFGWIPPAAALSEAETLIKDSDLAVVFVGLNSELEGEEMPGVNIPGFLGGDRTNLNLPESQENLVKAAVNTGKPIVVVLTSGSAIAANYAAEHTAALLVAWYGGEEAGTAIAETLSGANNPAGRLPVIFYRSVDQLQQFDSYDMQGRTYRFFKGDLLYPFGFGLSYSSFTYTGLSAIRTQDGAEIRATVKNTSTRDGDRERDAPIRSLRGFRRIHMRAGESREVRFAISSDDLPESDVEIGIGGGQPIAGIPHVRAMLKRKS